MHSEPLGILSLFSILILTTGMAFGPEKPLATALRVMSYNVRYDNPADGPNSWQHRKERVAHLIHSHQPDLLGLQEVLHNQLTYLEEELADYSRIGVGRKDGKQAGEFSPIFYDRKKLEVLDSGTFWLSTTPLQPSIGWDASLERIATWAVFRYRRSGDTVAFFNTHFDHRGTQAREESARLLLEKVEAHAAQYPVVVTGDFNSNPQSIPYQLLTQDHTLRDALTISEVPHVGPHQSFSGFEATSSLPGDRIDYVFVSSQVQVVRHSIDASSNDQYFPSDHLPVIAEVKW